MENLVDLILAMKEKEALELIERMLENGVDAFEILNAYHDAMAEIGLRFEREEILGDIKIMIGGGPMDNSIRDYVGADAYGKDAVEAVKIARLWTDGGL